VTPLTPSLSISFSGRLGDEAAGEESSQTAWRAFECFDWIMIPDALFSWSESIVGVRLTFWCGAELCQQISEETPTRGICLSRTITPFTTYRSLEWRF